MKHFRDITEKISKVFTWHEVDWFSREVSLSHLIADGRDSKTKLVPLELGPFRPASIPFECINHFQLN
jgi:hypothetical protein